jgi:hypothetical protein
LLEWADKFVIRRLGGKGCVYRAEMSSDARLTVSAPRRPYTEATERSSTDDVGFCPPGLGLCSVKLRAAADCVDGDVPEGELPAATNSVRLPSQHSCVIPPPDAPYA